MVSFIKTKIIILLCPLDYPCMDLSFFMKYREWKRYLYVTATQYGIALKQ